MDIYAKPGTKVVFIAENGGWSGVDNALEFFKKGAVLTVSKIEVGGWSSEVEFLEHKGEWFNTVMFEDL